MANSKEQQKQKKQNQTSVREEPGVNKKLDGPNRPAE